MESHSLEKLYHNWQSQLPQLMQRYRGIVVACSAGVDSTVLFHLLARFRETHFSFPLALCHINYCLRGEASDRAEELVCELAYSAGLPVFSYNLRSNPPPAHHIQSWARRLRYEKFAELARDGWLIAIAHHLDDCAENILLRLARGTSPGSLLGMKEFYSYFWRPLLLEPKASLLAWANTQGITYCEDESNQGLAYSRNVLRHKVLPILEELYPGATARMVRCAVHAQDLAGTIEQHYSHWISAARSSGLPCADFRPLAEGVACQVLSAMIGPVPEQRKRLTFKLLRALLDRLCEDPPRDFAEQLPGNIGIISIRSGMFRVHLTPPVDQLPSEGVN